MFMQTPYFCFLYIINYLGPGTRQVGEGLRMFGRKIMVAVRVVRLTRQAGLSGAARLPRVVLPSARELRALTLGMEAMQTAVPRKGDENLRRLAAALQPFGCGSGAGSPGQNAYRFVPIVLTKAFIVLL